VGSRGQIVGLVAQGQLDGAKELVVGQVGEGFGHLAERLLEQGAEALPERLEAGFAVKRGSVRGRIGMAGHGCALAVREIRPAGRTGPGRSYAGDEHFAPKIVKRSLRVG
jgi:hypothetical protein